MQCGVHRHAGNFKRLQDITVSCETEWTEKVVYNAVHEAMNERAVLVICQTIKDAEFLAMELQRYKFAKPIGLFMFARFATEKPLLAPPPTTETIC